MQPTITADPKECLADRAVQIRIQGLRPRQKVTIYAALNRNDVGKFESFAHYIADHEGIVDLATQPSIGGSYCGIEPMGLFWSMKPSPGNKRSQLRLIVRDVENPVEVTFTMFDSHLKYEEWRDCGYIALATTMVKRWYKSLLVKKIPVSWKRVRGTLFVPEGIGPFPALIDLFGIIGGIVEYRASLLASKGYMTLALAYFAYDDLPVSPDEIDLEYFEEAKELLESQPDISQGKVGLIGNSLGGYIALACARYISGFKCAVLINGPVISYGCVLKYKDRRWNAKVANMNLAYTDDDAYVSKYCYDEYYDVDSLGSSLIEFAECGTPLLFVFSKDDNAINIPKATSFIDKLFQDNKGDYEIVSYHGAGHLLEPPYFPLHRRTYVKLLSRHQDYGGEPKKHARAQKLAWGEIVKFLNKYLLQKSSKL